MPLVNKNPINEPMPDFTAILSDCPSTISPMMAPRNGQSIIDIPPKGEKIIPITMPIKQPRIPAFVPPNFLVLHTGIKLSMIKINTVMIA